MLANHLFPLPAAPEKGAGLDRPELDVPLISSMPLDTAMPRVRRGGNAGT